MSQQSTEITRHVIGSAQPLTGEIVPAMERVTVPAAAPTSPAPAPAPVRLPGTVPATEPSPTEWEWTAAPAGIDITYSTDPDAGADAALERRGPTRPGVPVSVLLSMGITLTGVAWAALSDTQTHPAALAAVIMAAAGLACTVVTFALAVCRDGK